MGVYRQHPQLCLQTRLPCGGFFIARRLPMPELDLIHKILLIMRDTGGGPIIAIVVAVLMGRNVWHKLSQRMTIMETNLGTLQAHLNGVRDELKQEISQARQDSRDHIQAIQSKLSDIRVREAELTTMQTDHQRRLDRIERDLGTITHSLNDLLGLYGSQRRSPPP